MSLRAATESPFAFFDAEEGGVLLLTGLCEEIDWRGEGEVQAVFAALEAQARRGRWVALAADYGLTACLEPALPAQAGVTEKPRLRAWTFERAQSLSANEAAAFLAERVAALNDEERQAGVAEVEFGMDDAAHAARVASIRRWIKAGDCYQVNLTFPLRFRVFGHPLALYAALRARQPVRYGGALFAPEATLLSLSPELFFERRGAQVVTRPMKGTARRGRTPEEDALKREALIASEKDRAENIMIVDLLRNDLGRLAAPGRVRVEALCAAEAYPTLWQLVSTVAAELPDATLFDLFRALFPCGSITGAPKIRAMRRIAQLETAPRGLYTGAFGTLSPQGAARFNVAIRTLEIDADGRGTLGVGGGIVIDSEPAAEYAECRLKARFLTDFDPGFELIETLRLEEGVCALLELHLARLSASARALGFRGSPHEAAVALAAEFSRHPHGRHRVRLTLAHDGRLRIVSAPMADDPGPWFAAFAPEPLNERRYLLRHKTTARPRYDAALAGLADAPGMFDLIFRNRRGEVCEGARSNVFIERDGTLLTPPLACGLLPGVLRRHLLDTGRAREAILRRDDLLNANRLFLGNAVRGLLPVRVRE